MSGSGASDRDLPPQGKDPVLGPVPDYLGYPLAAPERRQVARHPGGTRVLGTGRPDLHPLGASGGQGTPAAGAGAGR